MTNQREQIIEILEGLFVDMRKDKSGKDYWGIPEAADKIFEVLTPQPAGVEEILEAFREKWGRFYYSDKTGMDWEKPKNQNITGGIPNGHDGYCIASDDIENNFRQALPRYAQQEVRRKLKELNELVPEEKCCDVCEIVSNEATSEKLPL